MALVSGLIIFCASVATGWMEGVRSDEAGATGTVMPAEVAGFVLGAVISIGAATTLRKLDSLPD